MKRPKIFTTNLGAGLEKVKGNVENSEDIEDQLFDILTDVRTGELTRWEAIEKILKYKTKNLR